MTTRSLKLAKDLSLPLDIVTQKLAWLGVTGGGKTYGAMKLAELLHEAGAQFVTLDPVGVWYGLRLTKAGKPSDIAIPIFGGLHADVPLEPTGGALLADLVVDKNLSCILDVSQFESDAQKARFASDFAERLFFRRKAAPAAMHLFLEECQEFVPQNPQRGEERMLHSFTRMQKLGRNYGIGSSYISQRPQEVNKKALNMAQTLFVFRTTGVHERKAIEAWIADKSLDESIANDLPKLATGDCHVWSPEFLKVSEVVHILEKRTFDASAGAVFGVASKARELAPVDLDQVRAAMAATIEKAKADDPRELRKQIATLTREVASLNGRKPEAPKQHTGKVVEKAVLTDADRALLAKIGGQIADAKDTLALSLDRTVSAAYQKVQSVLDAFALEAREQCAVAQSSFLAKLDSKGFQKILGKLATVPAAPSPEVIATFGRRFEAAAHREPTKSRGPIEPRSRQGSGGDITLAPGERKILTAVAQFGDVDRGQLTVLVGYKATARDTYISRLAQKGLVESGQGRVRVTQGGIDALGSDYEPLPSGDALLAHWRGRLPSGEVKVLDAIVAVYPESISRQDLGERTEYKPTARDTYISRLASRRLVKSDGRGTVRASEELFS